MRTIVLDGAYMTSKEEAHNYLAKKLTLPDYYGKNLDALHDCLLDIHTPTNIVIYNRKTLESALELYANIMVGIFIHASKENDFIKVFFDIYSEGE